MAKEVERKFLVVNDSWKEYVLSSTDIRQAYISHRINGIVRLRICDDRAFLTIKGRTKGIERSEWEYSLPLADAEEMFRSRIYQGRCLEKTRYIVDYLGWKWEVDVFHGRHEGLVLAEIELPDASSLFPMPPFLGREVSHDPRYFNSNLNRGDLIP